MYIWPCDILFKYCFLNQHINCNIEKHGFQIQSLKRVRDFLVLQLIILKLKKMFKFKVKV
jgi:hypothetical protein